jgi:hypothetical protein
LRFSRRASSIASPDEPDKPEEYAQVKILFERAWRKSLKEFSEDDTRAGLKKSDSAPFTFPPSFARLSAIALPIPALAPITIAVLNGNGLPSPSLSVCSNPGGEH